MKDQDNIDDLFQTGAEPFDMEPSKKVWNALDAHLEKRNADLFRKKFVFYKRISIVLLLLLCSTITYFIIDSNGNSKGEGNSNDLAVVSSKSGNEKNNVIGNSDENNSSVGMSNGNSGTNNSANTNSGTSNSEKNSDEQSTITNHPNHFKKKSSKSPGTQNGNSTLPGFSNGNSPIGMNDSKNSAQQNATNNEIDWASVNSIQNKNSLVNPVFLPVRCTSTLSDSLASVTDSNLSSEDFKIPMPTSSHGFYLNAFYSPDFASHYLKDNNEEDGQSIAKYGNREHALYSYSSGITVGYTFNSHWSLQSGAIYSRMTQTISPSTIYAQEESDGQPHFELTTTTGTAELENVAGAVPAIGANMPLRRNSIQALQFVNLPLETKYQFNYSRFTFYGFGGASFNFLAQQQTFVKPTNEALQELNNISGLKSLSYGVRIGFGGQYNFLNGISVFGEPFYKASITSINRGAPISSFPFSVGMNIGFAYHF